MKKILITGACGYLGAWLSKYLAEKGYRIFAFVKKKPSDNIEWTSLVDEIIIGDICDEETIAKLTSLNIDVVIHLISLDHHKSENDPNFVSSINVLPTWILLDQFKKCGLNKFIYFSTIHIYGELYNNVIKESYNSMPVNTYALTHLLSENICNYYNNITNIDCINLRLSNSYGSPVFSENNCWWLVLNDLCKTAYQEKRIKLISDGSPLRDFIHISDICRATELLIKSKNDFKNNIFNISSGETLSVLELAHAVKSIYLKRYNREIEIHLPDNSLSKNPHNIKDQEKFVIDNSRITALGFEKKLSLKMGINEIFDYFDLLSK